MKTNASYERESPSEIADSQSELPRFIVGIWPKASGLELPQMVVPTSTHQYR